VSLDSEYDIIRQCLQSKNHISSLAVHKQGHHIIKKIIDTFPESKRQYVFDHLLENFKDVAVDQHGACILKELIKKTTVAANQRLIVEKIVENCMKFILD